MTSERPIFPGYTVLEVLHRGARRAVYRARDLERGASVIVKTAPEGVGADRQGSLRNEAALLQDLSVPGVPNVVKLELRGSRSALVLEDLGGETLAAVIRADSLSLLLRLKVARRLTQVLERIHAQGVIHRDINPNNILVDIDTLGCAIIDFELSTKRPSGTATLEGTPAYVSPEQTGRTPWDIDHRSDLYSLGVTLYELFTGKRPFDSADTLKVVHAHLALMPRPLQEVDAALPAILGDIVLKLMAKSPEERYQSAAGLEADLAVCEEAIETLGQVNPFGLGTKDFGDRLTLPDHLYGREREIAALRSALGRVRGGRGEVLLVAGYSGIGKTSLIGVLDDADGVQFVSGKFDQLVRGTPYTALHEALAQLAQKLLMESDESISGWRRSLLSSLGNSGQVVLDLIPEFEPVLGPQPAIPRLGPAESQNRFNRVFRQFIGALADQDHPLILFLDDLQWIDSASLDLIRVLLTDGAPPGLLMVGAYRDNEVSDNHPLKRVASDLERSGTAVSKVELAPLDEGALASFVADTLYCDQERAAPLASVLREKTGGNPFFMTQFIKALAQEHLIRLDADVGTWTYDLEGIDGMPSTDNVVALLAGRIERLHETSKEVLTVAACLGGKFDERTLAIGWGRSVMATRAALHEALREGLVLQDGGEADEQSPPTYQFLHDRVQQATYAQIPESSRAAAHVGIGRALIRAMDPAERAERAFELIDQFRHGLELVEPGNEDRVVFGLAVIAGRRARDAAAYAEALDYFQTAARTLPTHAWASEYDQAFDVHLSIAECQYLCGRFDAGFLSLDALADRAKTPLDGARVQIVRAAQYETMARYEDAVEALRVGLVALGIDYPGREGFDDALEWELDEAERALGDRKIADLIDLPSLADATTKMSLRLLALAWAPSYLLADSQMISWIPARMVRLSIAHGNTEESAYGYVAHGFTLGTRRGDYRRGQEFGLLALSLNDSLDDLRLRGKVHELFGCFVNLWRRPLVECVESQRTAFLAGIEGGDFAYGSYGGFVETWYGFLTGSSLAELEERFKPTLDFLRSIRNESFATTERLILNWALALRGLTEAPDSLDGIGFSESVFAREYRESAFFSVFLHVIKLHLFLTAGKFREACDAAEASQRVIHSVQGTIWPMLLRHYRAIALAATWDEADSETRERFVATISEDAGQLAIWAENCPENFSHAHLLVRAELARIQGDLQEAQQLYAAAIEAAHVRGFPGDLALSNERYARYWLGRGQIRIGSMFLVDALRSYDEWGAAPKAEALGAELSRLSREEGAVARTELTDLSSAGSVTATQQSPQGALDFEWAMKAAGAIASEIELDKLLATLMRTLLESAGAERGCLVLDQSDAPLVRVWGDATTGEISVQSSAFEEGSFLPGAMLRLVRRTESPVVADDAIADPSYATDPYVRSHRPRSALCLPVLYRSRFLGVMYLENNLNAGVFTRSRLHLLETLSAHAAIAIRNAELFEEVAQLEERLRAENVYLQETIKTHHEFEEIIGESTALMKVLEQVEQVAPTDSTVLIMGETGTGKELLARAIHRLSPRRDRSMVTVNCGAISPGLIESELFGHEKGAFTGAVSRKIGRFELADQSTILLDEIGDLAPDLQVKLLRVLQEGEFERVGGTAPIRTNVRVIAGTHRDLAASAAEGRFRPDLYYRLNVFPIQNPPLRERREDIPQLVRYFVKKDGSRLGKRLETIPKRTMDALLAYDWPGNVRELRNVIERSIITSRGTALELGNWFTWDSGASIRKSLQSLEAVQREHIKQTLSETGWVVSGPNGAARRLGLKPTTLEARMKKLGIERPH